MESFFTLLYLVPNRFSEEKIVVGILANIGGIPHFAYSDKKLNFGLASFGLELKAAIKKSFRLMDFDVNKIRRGEESLSLFDAPFSRKLLKELSHKKRGVIQYSDLFELHINRIQIDFEKLYEKFVGESLIVRTQKKKKVNFRTRFKEYTKHKKFVDFEKNYKLKANNYPFIYNDMTVDLLRKSTYYTVFYTLDFSLSLQSIQNNISKFRMIVQSLQQQSDIEGLSAGRYYLVYESTTVRSKLDLLNAIREERNSGYELIRMTEMKDKV